MRSRVAVGLVLLLALVGGWKWHSVRGDQAAAKVRIPTAEITRGPLVITLPVSGALESAQETDVRAEIAGILVDICPDNSPVQPEDFIFQLDTEELTGEREDRVRSLADTREEMNSAQADSETRIAQAESDVAAAKEDLALAQEKAQAEREKMAAQVAYAEGEAARAQRELTRSQRLAELNYIPGTKLRQAEKAYRRQQFDLDQQRAEEAEVEQRTAEEVESKETALALAVHELDMAKVDARSQLGNARIRVAEAERRLDETDRKIAQCTVTAPVAGLAVIQTNSSNWPERRPYRLGDQVQSGAAPVTIYDLTKMQVRCQIGEMDILRVRQGQEAFVVATKGKRPYRGKVALVEELAKDANVWEGGTPGKKVFGMLVSLEETDPTQLRPGMTVDLEVTLERRPETILVPLRAIFDEGGTDVAYRAQGTGFVRVPITVGARNDLLAEVRRGLQAGDRVALARPPAKPGDARRRS